MPSLPPQSREPHSGRITREVNEIQARVQAVLDEPWYWFPVRHHSASVAMHLQAAILERKPKLILVEGPSEANDLIPFVAHRKTRPPIAIYSCFRDDQNQFQLAGIASPAIDIAPRWACWFPLMEYSPELVAIRAAEKIGARVHFMDLPHFGRIEQEAKRLREEVGGQSPPLGNDPGAPSDSPRSWDHEPKTPATQRNWETEKLIAESDFFQALATAGGYKSWDEGWDALFEFRTFASGEEFRMEMLAFCCAARNSCLPQRIIDDGTLDRERFMLRSIRREIDNSKIDDADVMIVCGGFHVFLDRDDTQLPPAIPQGTIYTTVVPYTTFRISDLSGYGAGNRAPQFYQLHWDGLLGKVGNPRDEYLVSVLQAARKQGESVSAADAISVSQHARMLAALRGRATPLLDDLHDALITCCCKGDPSDQGARLKRAIDSVDIGNRIGKVIDGTPRLPIVDDFYRQIERLGLARLVSKEQVEKRELDKRVPHEFAIAAFFHRLQFTEIPFCTIQGQPQTEFETGLIFRERWTTKWSPEVEAKLIDQNLLGDSIESAAVNQLRKAIAENPGHAGLTCQMLVAALRMDLANLVDQVFAAAVTAIDEDSRFVSLCRAVSQLSVLDRHALHHDMNRGKIAEMFQRAFARACFAMIDIANAPDEQHAEIIDGLTTLADVVLKGDDDDQRQLFAQYVTATLRETHVAFLKGALIGLTVEIKLQSNQIVMDEIIGFARSAQEEMVSAGDFVHGVISVSRASIMAGAGRLVDALDELIRVADWDVFTIMLPRLRAAMELLHARHRDALATRVAEKYGMAESQTLQRLEVSVETAAEIVRIDRQVAAIMSKWRFDP